MKNQEFCKINGLEFPKINPQGPDYDSCVCNFANLQKGRFELALDFVHRRFFGKSKKPTHTIEWGFGAGGSGMSIEGSVSKYTYLEFSSIEECQRFFACLTNDYLNGEYDLYRYKRLLSELSCARHTLGYEKEMRSHMYTWYNRHVDAYNAMIKNFQDMFCHPEGLPKGALVVLPKEIRPIPKGLDWVEINDWRVDAPAEVSKMLMEDLACLELIEAM